MKSNNQKKGKATQQPTAKKFRSFGSEVWYQKSGLMTWSKVATEDEAELNQKIDKKIERYKKLEATHVVESMNNKVAEMSQGSWPAANERN